MEFTCECCNYTTQFKSNYSKHMFTDKHLLNHRKAHATKSETKSQKKYQKSSQSLPKVNLWVTQKSTSDYFSV